MNDNFYRQVIHDSPIGYCYTKALYDEYGRINDYLFLEVNRSFERMTGAKGVDIVGKFASEMINMINGLDLNLIAIYHEAASKRCKQELTHFSPALSKWFRVGVYSPEADYFITQFMDLTNEIAKSFDMAKVIGYSEELLKNEKIDHQKICDNFLSLSNAKFALFKAAEDGTVKAVSGGNEFIEQAADLFDPFFEYRQQTVGKSLSDKDNFDAVVKYASIEDILEDTVPSSILNMIQKQYQTGEAVVIHLINENMFLGEVLLIMDEDKSFDKENAVNMFAKLTGLAMFREKNLAQQSYPATNSADKFNFNESKSEYEETYCAIFDQAPIAFELFDPFGVFLNANETFMRLVGIDRFDEIAKINLFNIPNLTKEMKTKLLAREPIRLEAIFDFDFLKKKQYFQTCFSGVKSLMYRSTRSFQKTVCLGM